MKLRVAVAVLVGGLAVPWASAQIPAGGEFQVNTFTTSYQYHPRLASDAAGNFVVTWTSDGQDGSGLGVFARRFNAAGAPQGAEFQVNTFTPSYQYRSTVAADAAGNFVVVWTSADQDGSGYGIFGQRFNASGSRLGSEFRVNTYTIDNQYEASVASDAAFDFVVVWASYGQDGSGWGVFGQRYDASGAPLGAEFRANPYTASDQLRPVVASDAAGDFVVGWESDGQDGSGFGVFAQRYDASGAPQGTEFRVNSTTSLNQYLPSVASDAAGNFVIVWTDSSGEDGSGLGVFAQRYDASGVPRGGEFRANTTTAGPQALSAVASDAAGTFVVTWQSLDQDGDNLGIFAQKFVAGVPRAEFQVNTFTTSYQYGPAVASDPVGNFLVAWTGDAQDGSLSGVFAQRYGGLPPAALAADAAASSGSDGNGLLEPGETSVAVAPSWKNVNGAELSFNGSALGFTGPSASGVSYLLTASSATYGTVANGATAQCTSCYAVGVQWDGSTRPETHWDATLTEKLTPGTNGQTKLWSLHVGGSFADVPKTSAQYSYVETILHKGITAGCGADTYCPASATSRQQMTIFALRSKEGAGYLPQACGATPLFGDVPVTSPFCRWVEEMSRRGVVSGCGGGNFCPANPVSRAQMAVFVLKTLDPAMSPPACGTPVFSDVPASSPYCPWVEELARRGVVAGCGAGNYCPSNPVTRGQMGVFLTRTFGLTLYGP